MRSRSTLILLLAASLTFGAAPRQAKEQEPLGPKDTIGKKAPPLKAEGWINTNGKALSLAKLKGKVVLLDFWAYW